MYINIQKYIDFSYKGDHTTCILLLPLCSSTCLGSLSTTLVHTDHVFQGLQNNLQCGCLVVYLLTSLMINFYFFPLTFGCYKPYGSAEHSLYMCARRTDSWTRMPVIEHIHLKCQDVPPHCFPPKLSQLFVLLSIIFFREPRTGISMLKRKMVNYLLITSSDWINSVIVYIYVYIYMSVCVCTWNEMNQHKVLALYIKFILKISLNKCF